MKNSLTKKLKGSFDTCNQYGIKGWIIDEEHPKEPIEIGLFIDGLLITRIATSYFLDPGNEKKLFHAFIPDQCFDELAHQVEVREITTGWVLPNNPKIFCSKDYFNYLFYIECYPLLSQLSYKEASKHYYTYGITNSYSGTEEHFFKKKNISNLPKDFDFKVYLNLHPDLMLNLGYNKYLAIDHYLSYGIKEKRKFKLDTRFFNLPISKHGISFNITSDIIRSHNHQVLDTIMHVFDAYWHGIRSATGCLPGHKVAISHKHVPSDETLAYLCTYVKAYKIQKICYQGLSEHALSIAEFLHGEFGSSIQQYVITHVSSAQFENHFEMQMLGKMLDGLKTGLFTRLGAVKPRFSGVISEFWPHTLINAVPNLTPFPIFRDLNRVFIPVENNWRKNLYTNVLAAIHCEAVKKINIVNWPNAIEHIAKNDKLEWLPFMKPLQMLSHSASCAAIMHSSLIECQPMTHLEGLAVGTPCITAKLGVHPIIDAHPLTQLCEVDFSDDVGALTRTLSTICQIWQSDPNSLNEMIKDYIKMRNELSMQSYLEFLA